MSLEDFPTICFLLLFIVNNRMADVLNLQGGNGTRTIYFRVLKLCVAIDVARWLDLINVIS